MSAKTKVVITFNVKSLHPYYDNIFINILIDISFKILFKVNSNIKLLIIILTNDSKHCS
jgi:hypothetical protein